jgi:WD40 repeat protein
MRPTVAGPVRRPEIENEVARLLDDWDRRKTLTVVLHAPGGFGKTTLADILSNTPTIADRFEDGVYWIGLGETVDQASLVAQANDLSFLLSGTRPDLQDAHLASQRLTRTLFDKSVMLVLDDTWRLDDVSMFVGGNSTCRLITTRDLRAVPEDSVVIRVPSMSASESWSLLTSGMPLAGNSVENLGPLEQLAKGWPVLLKLLNANLKEDVQSGLTLDAAAMTLVVAFQQRGLSAFASEEVQYRHAALASLLDDSLDRLSPEMRRRYLMLAAFPDSVDIPTSVLARTWRVSTSEADQACRALYRSSLIHVYVRSEPGISYVRLHDIVREILRNRDEIELANAREQVIVAWRDSLTSSERQWWHTIPVSEPYIWRYAGWQLTEAGRWSDYSLVVGDLWFLSHQSVVCGRSATETELRRAVRIRAESRPLLDFFDRLGHILDALTGADDRQATLASWLVIDQWPTNVHLAMTDHRSRLDAAGHASELRHTGGVLKCKAIMLAEELVVSASSDRSVGLWSVRSLQRLGTFLGHTDWVRACAVDPAGSWIVSGSDDATLRMWDPISGECLRVLRGHERPIRDCAVAPDGQTIVSAGGDDRSVRLWNPSDGTERTSLPGHKSWVMACDVAPSGSWIVSGSVDASIRFWDTHTGKLISVIDGQPTMLWDCVKIPNQPLLAVGGIDGRVQLIELNTPSSSFEIGSHEATVRRIAARQQGDIIASVSDDGTAVLWDINNRRKIHMLTGHTNGIRSGAFNAEGSHLVTASHDKTLRIWNVATGELEAVLTGHSAEVSDCCWLASDRIVSTSYDGTLAVWTPTGEILRRVEIGELLTTCAPDPRNHEIIVVGSESSQVTAWDIDRACLVGKHSAHRDWVARCTFRPQGVLVASASDDHTLRIWNPAQSEPMCAIAVDEPLYSVTWHDTEADSLFAVGAGGVYSFQLSQLGHTL